MTGALVAGPNFEVGIALDAAGVRRVYARDPSGATTLFTPSVALRAAKQLRATGEPTLIDVAKELDALALEIETTAGSA